MLKKHLSQIHDLRHIKSEEKLFTRGHYDVIRSPREDRLRLQPKKYAELRDPLDPQCILTAGCPPFHTITIVSVRRNRDSVAKYGIVGNPHCEA
ncbi:hypothetical protein [Novipirellula galeiformis]|uniref:hypothetical protein n=1 Tax=Novipirellula galeiformis TaxID=2528004 RepID=UPI0011B7ABC3|nr:hypothetical protein [Novipirellula galeiformis]